MRSKWIRERLGAVGVFGIVAVCCGGHLVALAAAAGVGAGLLAFMAR